jgi:CheY-like chemotaxis protein
MEDRSGTKDRGSAWKPRKNHPAPARPGPDPPPPTVPGPIPWIPTAAVSEVTRDARSHPRSDALMMRVIDGGAATPSEPAIQSSAADAFRQLPLRLVEPPVADAPRAHTVLLIDDNHHHRIPLLRALRAERYDVLYAADGARGEDLFRTSPHEIDALIAPAEMRHMSGFELARRVRSARPEIAVLLMCRSFTSADHADSPFERGFPVIEEPFNPEQLTRRLAELLAASPSTDCPEAR